MADEISIPVDEEWWCWECHGLGSWETFMEDDEYGPREVGCHCCGGAGNHGGDEPPPCAPKRKP